MTQIRCLVSESSIAARQCVDAQVEQHCWCSKAPLAVVEVAQVALPGSKLAEQIDRCKIAAGGMLRKAVGDRYDGPALQKIRAAVAAMNAPPAVAPSAPLPAPKPAETQKPALEKQERRMPAPTPAAPRPALERQEPAPPAKESSMLSPLHKVTDDEFRKAHVDVGGSINKLAAKFSAAWSTTRDRANKLGLLDVAAKATAPKPAAVKPATKPTKPRRVNGKRRPRSLDDVAAKHAPPSAPPADIVGLLQRQLDHHQEQADKCKRALAALQ